MKNRNQQADRSTSRTTCEISLAQILPAISQSSRPWQRATENGKKSLPQTGPQ